MADNAKNPPAPPNASKPQTDRGQTSLRKAFIGNGVPGKPQAEVPKIGQRRPVEDEDRARTQTRKENTARLDSTLEYGRPAVFVREKPGEPGVQQFMTIMAGTVKADGDWDGWTVHPDTGASRVNRRNNTQGKWKHIGYLAIVDEKGNPVPLKKNGE